MAILMESIAARNKNEHESPPAVPGGFCLLTQSQSAPLGLACALGGGGEVGDADDGVNA